MKKSVRHYILVFLSLVILSGCQTSPEEIEKDFTWKIQVHQAEVKNTLRTVEVMTLYNGEKKEVEHVDNPGNGNVFVILLLTLTKSGSSPASFEWNDVVIMDAKGTSYSRLENDSFLAQHNYTPRMTGLPLKFGENKGWVAFEVAQSALRGDLFLVHTSDQGEQRIKIKQ